MKQAATRKAKQNAINNICINELLKFDNETSWGKHIRHDNSSRLGNVVWHSSKSEQLRHCDAVVYETSKYIVLRSYNTIVAFIDKSTGNLFDVLRYVYGFTSSSCKQISKFADDYAHGKIYTYKSI